jgi:hypothetical protein
MPSLETQHAPPSTLTDVVGQVREAFDAMADMTPIMVGSQYLENGVGEPPHVVFMPEPGGKVGPAIEMGNPCSITHSCDVLVRAAETGDELTRLDNAYALAARVIDCIATAAPGRVEFSSFSDESPTKTDAFGAEIAFSFTYRRDVRHDPTRWALVAAPHDTSAASPILPPGQPALDVAIDVATQPTP